MWEERSRVPHAVSCVGHPELSKVGTSWVGQPGSLSNCGAGCSVYSRWDDVFEVDAWSMKSLMSGIHTTVEKMNCQALILCTITCITCKFFVDALY